MSPYRHEFWHYILLFLIVACWQTHFLLTLIVHHLLHQRSCFAIQVGKFRRFRIDLLSWHCRIWGDQLVPPWHLVDFLQSNDDGVFVDCPKRIFRFNFCVQYSVNDWRLILQAEFQSFLADDAYNVAWFETGNVAEWHTKLKNKILLFKLHEDLLTTYFEFLQRLRPAILLKIATISCIWFQLSFLGFISILVSFIT